MVRLDATRLTDSTSPGPREPSASSKRHRARRRAARVPWWCPRALLVISSSPCFGALARPTGQQSRNEDLLCLSKGAETGKVEGVRLATHALTESDGRWNSPTMVDRRTQRQEQLQPRDPRDAPPDAFYLSLRHCFACLTMHSRSRHETLPLHVLKKSKTPMKIKIILK
ncbi:hypothetical protein C8R47DRAFT_195697 [Mycena vitilis]|nr:hypothetical protein C8R47DRAFT_195697 [Mycena vitilis]